jgi:hypothetical protein
MSSSHRKEKSPSGQGCPHPSTMPGAFKDLHQTHQPSSYTYSSRGSRLLSSAGLGPAWCLWPSAMACKDYRLTTLQSHSFSMMMERWGWGNALGNQRPSGRFLQPQMKTFHFGQELLLDSRRSICFHSNTLSFSCSSLNDPCVRGQMQHDTMMHQDAVSQSPAIFCQSDIRRLECKMEPRPLSLCALLLVMWLFSVRNPLCYHNGFISVISV